MPWVDLHYPEGSLDDARLARVAERIAAAARKAEGLADTPAARAISVVNCVSCRVFVDGKPSDARFQIVVHAFAEALDAAAKRRLVAELTAAFREACPDRTDAVGSNVWCRIDAIAPGDFAAAGAPVSLAAVRAMTGA